MTGQDGNEDDLELGSIDQIIELVREGGAQVQPYLNASYNCLKNVQLRYGRMQFLGEGGLKQVFRCRDEHSRRYLAYARPHEVRSGQRNYESFIQEAWLTASLSHPNIIKIYDIGVQPDGVPYFTMDLLSSSSLVDLTRDTDLTTKLQTYMTICQAVSYAHSRGILHLDLKPENIQTGEYGEILVCDWGLGVSYSHNNASETGDEDDALEATFMKPYAGAIGTPGYMAPEQFSSHSQYSPATDVYALGGILYYLLSGQAPHEGSLTKIHQHTQRGQVTPPHQFLGQKVPKALSLIAMKALSTSPENRYQSVKELQSEIAYYLEQRPTQQESRNLLRRSQLFFMRHRLATSFSFLIIGLGCVLVALWESVQQKQLSVEKLESAVEVFEETERDHALQLNAAIREFQRFFIQAQASSGFAKAKSLFKAGTSFETNAVDHAMWLNYLHSLELDYGYVVENKVEDVHGKFLAANIVAESFSDLTYNINSPPNAETLLEVMRYISDIQITELSFAGKFGYMTDLLLTNYRANGGESIDIHVLAYYISFYNNHLAEVRADEDLGRIEITANQAPLRLARSHIAMLTRSCCRIQLLKISSQHSFDVRELDNLRVSAIDLSEVPVLYQSRPFEVHGLKNVSVSKEEYRSYFSDLLSQ